MQFYDLDLNIDLRTGSLVRDFNSGIGTSIPALKRSDIKRVNVRALLPTRQPDRPWREVSLAGKTVRVAVGIPGEDFVSGTFTIGYGGYNTTPLDYTSTAAQVEAALNSLPSIIAHDLVDVTGIEKGPWLIRFRVVGARTAFSVNANELFPIGIGVVSEASAGDVDSVAETMIELEIKALAYAELENDFPAPFITVSEILVGSAINNSVQRVDLSDPEPYDGVYSLTFAGATTIVIPWDATAADIQALFNREAPAGLGVDAVNVTGVFPVFDVEFQGTYGNSIQPVLAPLATSLIVPKGRSGFLNLGGFELGAYLRGNRSGQAYFEVEISDESGVNTMLQVSVDLLEDLINNTIGSPSQFPDPSAYLRRNEPAPVTEVLLPAYGASIVLFGDGIAEEAGDAREVAFLWRRTDSPLASHTMWSFKSKTGYTVEFANEGLTASRSLNIPNKSGTLALTDDDGNLSSLLYKITNLSDSGYRTIQSEDDGISFNFIGPGPVGQGGYRFKMTGGNLATIQAAHSTNMTYDLPEVGNIIATVNSWADLATAITNGVTVGGNYWDESLGELRTRLV